MFAIVCVCVNVIRREVSSYNFGDRNWSRVHYVHVYMGAWMDINGTNKSTR